MTKEQINIAIAEAQGWKRNMGDWYRPNANCQCITRSKSDGGYTIYPPDYCNDLNAMYEVEKTLRHGMTYVINLHRICNNDQSVWDLPTTNLQFNYVTASALQRAEAYLRTIGKWKD